MDPGCPARQCKQEETGNETESGKKEKKCECKARPEITKWDLLYTKDFYNQTLTAELLEHLRSYWDEIGTWVLVSVEISIL